MVEDEQIKDNKCGVYDDGGAAGSQCRRGPSADRRLLLALSLSAEGRQW